MVPEGLVLLTSVAFAIGVVRLGRRQCLVQELPAIEGLARVDVVCLDKTGTLTEGGMDVPSCGCSTAPTSRTTAQAAGRPRRCRPAAQRQPPGDHRRLSGAGAEGWRGRRHAAVQLGPQVQRRGPHRAGRRPRYVAAGRARRAAARRARGARRGRPARRRGAAGAAAGPHRPGAGRPARSRTGVVPHGAGGAGAAAAARRGATRCGTSPTRTSRPRSISGDNAVAVGAVAAGLGLPGAERPVDARRLPDERAEMADGAGGRHGLRPGHPAAEAGHGRRAAARAGTTWR